MLSLISATIFWIIFAEIPILKKKSKIRPIIELDLFHIKNSLFRFFNIIMEHSKTSPSFFGNKIASAKLSKEDIKLGLQNKCLNPSYLFDQNVSKYLLVIGSDIYNILQSIEELINKIVIMKDFANESEIILIEKIRQEIRIFDNNLSEINKSAQTKIGNKIYFPAVSSLYYKGENYYSIS